MIVGQPTLVSLHRTSYPVTYGLDIAVSPSPASARGATVGSILVKPAAATAKADTLPPTVPNPDPLGIGTMTIGTTFEVG